MFLRRFRLQHEARVDAPDPVFAGYLQQAVGGVEGEVRVAMQDFSQAMGARGDKRFRDVLMTATEEFSHIERLGHAVALNSDKAPLDAKEAAAEDLIGATIGGMNLRHVHSSGLSAMPVNANSVPFDLSHVYATGNIGADRLVNAMAGASGRVPSRLYDMTEDAGVKDMLPLLIARDTLHRQQWLAVIEEPGGIEAVMPVPNSTRRSTRRWGTAPASSTFPPTSLRRGASGPMAARPLTGAGPIRRMTRPSLRGRCPIRAAPARNRAPGESYSKEQAMCPPASGYSIHPQNGDIPCAPSPITEPEISASTPIPTQRSSIRAMR
nr:manganese catalase family protein [Jannaschia formosa]